MKYNSRLLAPLNNVSFMDSIFLLQELHPQPVVYNAAIENVVRELRR